MAIWFGDPPTPEELTARGAHCMLGHVGIEFTEVGTDFVAARMPIDQRTKQPVGLLHGGASVVLAETLGSVGGTLCVDPEVKQVVGLEINANHVRPATGGWVHGRATPEAIGRTTQVWSIRITDDAGKLVCVSRITLAVIDKRAP